MTGRVKSVSSTFRKLLRERTKVDRVKDIVALRVVLTPAPDVAQTLEAQIGRPVSGAEVDALVCYSTYMQVTAQQDSRASARIAELAVYTHARLQVMFSRLNGRYYIHGRDCNA